MIEEYVVGDITDPGLNPRDIIIGMNTRLSEPSAIGRPFIRDVSVMNQLKLGSVLSFNFDEKRFLHMLICHKIGFGGWMGADEHIRFGLDYLRYQYEDRSHSIVQIGNGPIGRRDGANTMAIRTAITTSFLKMNLFILPDRNEAQVAVELPPMIPFRVWDMKEGERKISLQ